MPAFLAASGSMAHRAITAESLMVEVKPQEKSAIPRGGMSMVTISASPAS
jgi:hypothetical protein